MPEQEEEARGRDNREGAHIGDPGRQVDVETGFTFKSTFMLGHFKSIFITPSVQTQAYEMISYGCVPAVGKWF